MAQKIIVGRPLVEEQTQRKELAAFPATGGLMASRGVSPIEFGGDGHLITIAPTGAGKGRSCIIPNLLKYEGSAIVLDPKGETFRVTSRARESMGQKIVKLDPFHLLSDEHSDSFNPFDILQFTGKVINDEVRGMVEAILGDPIHLKDDPFWDEAARSLIAGLALYLATHDDSAKRTISELRALLYKDDVVYNIAKTLDDEKGILREAYEEMSIYLQAAERARQDILMSAQNYFRPYGSPSIQKCINTTSFDLKQLLFGEPITIYIVIPPSKLLSHQKLLRAWIGAILALISTRKEIPKLRTLLILDEVAQLGHFRALESAITLLRGYGLVTWSFWQDISQLRQLYPQSSESILNNCSVVQLFGLRNNRVAKEFGEIMGVDASHLRELATDEQALMISNEGPLLARKLDYLNDRQFEGLFDENPQYKYVSAATYD
jgi:type IV secretion system protein VirD4